MDDAEAAMRTLADQLITAIMAPRVQQIRRLVIAEASRFPDLGRIYWERGFERVLRTLAAAIDRFAERGLLKVADSMMAANQFVGMLLWIPSNRAMFYGRPDVVTPDELARFAAAAATTFLAAYGATG
jgi:TetR/AcrR family transcriptional repressor of mexJK operon